MNKKELFKINRELDRMALDGFPAPDKPIPQNINKKLDRMALYDELTKKELSSSKKTKPKKASTAADDETVFIKKLENETLLLEQQALIRQAEEANNRKTIAALLFLASFISIFIPGFFWMGLLLMGATYYVYKKEDVKREEYLRSAKNIQLRSTSSKTKN